MTASSIKARLLRTQKTADVWNAILNFCGAPLALDQKGSTAMVVPAERPSQAGVGALISIGSTRLVILFNAFPFKDHLDAEINVAGLMALPPILRDALVEAMVSYVWALIPDNQMCGYSLVSIHASSDFCNELERSIDWFDITIEIKGQTPVRFNLGCESYLIPMSLMEGRVATTRASDALLKTLTVGAYFSFAPLASTVSEVSALQAGDVIVLNQGHENVIFLFIGRDRHEFRRTDAGWIYVRFTERNKIAKSSDLPQEMLMTNEDSAGQPSEALSFDTGRLPIDLDFEIGERQLPLSTIASWKVDSLVELDPPDVNEDIVVSIRANGRKIARGDLVRIDSRLAVKITHILGD